MNVFVWKQYGDISVYTVETPTQILSVYGDIRAIVNDYGCEDLNDTMARCDKWIERYPTDPVKLRRVLAEMADALTQSGDDDSFELGTGLTTLKE